MASAPASRQPYPRRLFAAGVCALAGVALFQFFGNSSRGYIDTASLFYWWGSQWVNPASELEHAWLILPISLWLLWRNIQKGRALGSSGDQSDTGPDFVACAALLFALGLHALGFVAQQARISIVALLL